MTADNSVPQQRKNLHFNSTHGYSSGPKKAKIYDVWRNMKSRCLRKTSTHYADYGGRGITVCDRWLHSFENFLADMGDVPSPGYTIERINNDGHYEPSNCRWVSMKDQSNNRRSSVFIEYIGMRKTIAQWADHVGIPMRTLHSRISRGWDFGLAVTKPLRKWPSQIVQPTHQTSAAARPCPPPPACRRSIPAITPPFRRASRRTAHTPPPAPLGPARKYQTHGRSATP